MTKRKSSPKVIISSAPSSSRTIQAPFVSLVSLLKKILGYVYNPLKKYIFTENNKHVLLAVIIFALIGDLFFKIGNSDLDFFGIIGIFIITTLFYKVASKFTFMLCLALLAIMYVSFLLNGTSEFTEKASVWIVLFMTVGIFQQWNE